MDTLVTGFNSGTMVPLAALLAQQPFHTFHNGSYYIALVNQQEIYYFNAQTTLSCQFYYHYHQHYPLYSEYCFSGSDGREYLVFNLLAARTLLPTLILKESLSVISPVTPTLTLIHTDGAREQYPIVQRLPMVKGQK
jgi:hypothetical protein